MNIWALTTSGRCFELGPFHEEVTARGVKLVVEKEMGIPPAEQRVLYSGKELIDECMLATAGVEAGSMLTISHDLRGGYIQYAAKAAATALRVGQSVAMRTAKTAGSAASRAGRGASNAFRSTKLYAADALRDITVMSMATMGLRAVGTAASALWSIVTATKKALAIFITIVSIVWTVVAFLLYLIASYMRKVAYWAYMQ